MFLMSHYQCCTYMLRLLLGQCHASSVVFMCYDCCWTFITIAVLYFVLWLLLCQYQASSVVFMCYDYYWTNMIGELVQVRDGQLHLHISQCELCAFIEYVCMM